MLATNIRATINRARRTIRGRAMDFILATYHNVTARVKVAPRVPSSRMTAEVPK